MRSLTATDIVVQAYKMRVGKPALIPILACDEKDLDPYRDDLAVLLLRPKAETLKLEGKVG